MMKAYFQKRIFLFKNPAGTSRGVLKSKPSWFIYLYDENQPEIKGIGECSIIPGLSIDNERKIEQKLSEICMLINKGEFDFSNPITDFPAISFGLETALLDYNCSGTKELFPSEFTAGNAGIPINGLIWMGDLTSLQSQVKKKIDEGFKCIKLKIGAISLDEELLVLSNIRKQYSANDLELRVDANGSFGFNEVPDILKKLADLEIHSIEQPIFSSQLYEMAKLCEKPPIPIALDEELLGKYPYDNKRKLVELLKPQYLVLKPSLLGGFKETTEWINIADEFGIGWWITSALESNIGLNAIAQWTYTLNSDMPQGLGTGLLFERNINSPLEIKSAKLFYNDSKVWSYEFVY